MTSAAGLVALVALPFAGALLPARVSRFGRTTIAWSAAVAPLCGLVLLYAMGWGVFDGTVVAMSQPWVTDLGLDFALRLDGLALLFATLIFGIGALVILYARYYMAPADPFARFLSMLLVFMGAMIGIALSDNLLLTLVFWELTSVASFLLIGYWHRRPDARQGAVMALTVTGLGGLALIAGALLLGHIAGTFTLSEIVQRGDAIRAHEWYPAALVLILLGAFTKSAQFPFHFWLPNAMAAPTPASAYLHSATMVKAGIFLLARLWPALSGTDLWFWLVGGTGMGTLVFGAYAAMFRHDLKGLLAYSTISHLGLITLLLGLNSRLAAVAAVFHIMNHATFKASLFMAAGIIDHETGTRDMRKLAGLWRSMPHTGALAMVAAAAMAGVPLLNGFLSKEMFFAETLELQSLGVVGYLVPVAATLAAVFSVAYSTRFIHDVFFNGEAKGLSRTPHDPPRWMLIPVEVLVAICLLVGIAPRFAIGPLLDAAAGSVVGGAVPVYSLALWHGFNLPFAMSVVAIIGGVIVYFVLQRRFGLHARDRHDRLSGHRLFQNALDALTSLATRVARVADGTLRRQVAVLLLVALAGAALPFAAPTAPRELAVVTDMTPVAILAWLVLAIATVAVVALHRHRLTALVLTGAIGLVVSLAFAFFSAPDLALTQLAVEVVTVLVMLFALPFLPDTAARDSSALRHARDVCIAVAAGVGMGGGAWFMLTSEGRSVSAEYLARSISEAGGTNVVNVILVDFRGFDTYGEITVLAIAALGIATLLGSRPAASAMPGSPADARAFPVMLALLSRLLVPLGLLLAAHLFLRGHNLPGGGFVAGLVAGVVLAVLSIGNGRAWVRERLRIDFGRVLASGLAIAGATGIGAWAFGQPFLKSAHGHLHLPLLGDVHWASAALFDLGVFRVGVGVVMLILDQLGSLAPPRRVPG